MKRTPDFFLEHAFSFCIKGALFRPISVPGSVPRLSNQTAEIENISNIIMGPDLDFELPSGIFVSINILSYIIVPMVQTLFCFTICKFDSRYLLNFQEEHDNIRDIKGKNQPLEWSDYKSMPFTQCVIILESIPIFLHFLIAIPCQKQNAVALSFFFERNIIAQLDLTFLQVINETLRVANLISGVFRRANTDIHFKGMST
jgi:hypothetical protein